MKNHTSGHRVKPARRVPARRRAGLRRSCALPGRGAALMSVSTIVVALNAQLLRRSNLSSERITSE